MFIVFDKDGGIVATGEANTFVAPEGGRIVEADIPADALYQAGAGAGGPVAFSLDVSGKTPRIVARARAATATEQERTDRDGILAQIDTAITGWPSATNAAKLDAVLLCLKAIRAIARYVLRG